MDWRVTLALYSCALLGLRHGFDYDHLAAIADITAVERTWQRGMALGLIYASGHALTVVVLGASVIFLHVPLPARLDNIAERLIGATLILLAITVLASVLRRAHSHNLLQSRIALLVHGTQWLFWRMRKLFCPETPRPVPFQFDYGSKSAFVVGMLHGFGAETPSQLMLFLLTASLGGTVRGLLGLTAFALGLIAMNGLMTASLGGIFTAGMRRPWLYQAVAVAGAVYSLVIGVLFLFAGESLLPSLGG